MSFASVEKFKIYNPLLNIIYSKAYIRCHYRHVFIFAAGLCKVTFLMTTFDVLDERNNTLIHN